MSNLSKRIIFGLVYVLVIIFGTRYNEVSSISLFFVFMLFCIYEFQKMIQIKSIYPYIFGVIFTFIILALFLLNTTNTILFKGIYTIFFLAIFTPFIINLFKKDKSSTENLSKLFLSIVYSVIPFIILMSIPYITKYGFDNKILLGIFILIWTNDTFAYLVGSKIGKHKLFERISPNKTIEGFIGGFVFTLFAAIILSKYYTTTFSTTQWLVFAVTTSVFGTLGDLIESKFKREAKLKDSSNLIPGHGGFLDRLDSLIFTAPIIMIYLLLIL